MFLMLERRKPRGGLMTDGKDYCPRCEGMEQDENNPNLFNSPEHSINDRPVLCEEHKNTPLFDGVEFEDGDYFKESET